VRREFPWNVLPLVLKCFTLYLFKVPKSRNFPTLAFLHRTNKKFSRVVPIPSPTWYDSLKKTPKAHWDQAQDCHVHATNGTIQHASKRARLFPFERAEGRGEEGILLNFGVPSKFPHAQNNSQ